MKKYTVGGSSMIWNVREVEAEVKEHIPKEEWNTKLPCPRCGEVLYTDGEHQWCSDVGGAKKSKDGWAGIVEAAFGASCMYGIDELQPLLDEYWKARVKRFKKWQARKLRNQTGERHKTRDFYSPEEDAILRRLYLAEGLRATMDALPGRSASSIYRAASKRGMHRKKSRYQEWEDDLIREKYAELGPTDLALMLPRHTYKSVANRGRELGQRFRRGRQRNAVDA